MAVIPTPKTWVPGTKPFAVDFNTNIRDAVNFLLAPPQCTAYLNAGPITCTSGTWTKITLDSEVYDTDSMHTTSGGNTSRITATTAGLYSVSFSVSWASNATGVRGVDLRKNSYGSPAGGSRVSVSYVNAVSGVTTFLARTLDVRLLAGEYLEIFAYQDSGANRNVNTGAEETFMTVRFEAI